MTSKETKQYHTYIILCDNGAYYTGYSDNPYRRFMTHLSGEGARYTRSHKPVRLVYVSKPMTRSEAMRTECQIKRLSHSQKRELVEKGEVNGNQRYNIKRCNSR